MSITSMQYMAFSQLSYSNLPLTEDPQTNDNYTVEKLIANGFISKVQRTVL